MRERFKGWMIVVLTGLMGTSLFPQTPKGALEKALSVSSSPQLFRQKLKEVQEKFPSSLPALQALLLEA